VPMGRGIESRIITYHPLYLSLGKSKLERVKNYRETFAPEIDKALLSDIRYATYKGQILGTDKFQIEVAVLTDQRTFPKRRGPKPKPR